MGKARAIFLQGISDLRPCVINDLYEKVYGEFIYAVAEHFRAELFSESITTNSENAFLRLAKRAIEGIEESNEPNFLATLPREVRESLVTPRVYLLDLHLRGQLSDPLLIDTVTLPLMRTIGRLRQCGEDRSRRAFQNWRALSHSETVPLRKALRRWSVRWNLNAEWCRDHALKVLSEWLSDETLRWSYLPYVTRSPRLLELWNYEARQLAFNVNWSQAVLSDHVHRGNPKPFKSQVRGIDFEFRGLNLIIERAGDWKGHALCDFRMQIYRTELSRLEELKRSGNLFNEADLENKFSGQLGTFESKLNRYVAEMRQNLAASRKKLDLIEVKAKRDLLKHVRWAVRYQIPKGKAFERETLAAIGAPLKSSAVSRAVTAILAQIGLKKETPPKMGRKLGSKNKPSAGKTILRGLGR